MATIVKLGPADQGRPMSLRGFLAGDYEEGYHYELIDGELYVSPEPNLPEDWVEKWMFAKVMLYSWQHSEVLNYVTNKGRVFVPGRRRATCPQPDVAAYRDFPRHLPIRKMRWQDVSPRLIGEVLSRADPAKDLVRNVELYLQVPTIQEYWLLDGRANADRPTMRVYRRQGRKWRIIELAFGDVYTTRLLPGFALTLDPRS